MPKAADEPDRVPVAQPRSRPCRPATDSPSPGAVDAGLTLIVLIAAFAAGGAWIGDKIGAWQAGAMISIPVGLAAGFAAIYARHRDL